MRRRCLILGTACACLAVGVNAGLEDYESYPKRSDADAAVIEWGHSAMIQSVDGVVASFGAQISETEAALFEVEASVVMSQPPQACGKGGLKNAAKLHGQIARLNIGLRARRAKNHLGLFGGLVLGGSPHGGGESFVARER